MRCETCYLFTRSARATRGRRTAGCRVGRLRSAGLRSRLRRGRRARAGARRRRRVRPRRARRLRRRGGGARTGVLVLATAVASVAVVGRVVTRVLGAGTVSVGLRVLVGLGLGDVLDVATTVHADRHLLHHGGRRRSARRRVRRPVRLVGLVVAALADRHAGTVRTLGADLGGRPVPRVGSDVHGRVAAVGTNRSRPVDGAVRSDRNPPDVARLVADLVEANHLVAIVAGVAVHAGVLRELHGNHALSPKEGRVKLVRRVLQHQCLGRLVGGRGAVQVSGVLGGSGDGLLDEGLAARVIAVLAPVDLVAHDDLALLPAHRGQRVGEAVSSLVGADVRGKCHDVGLVGLRLERLPDLGVLGLELVDVHALRLDDGTDVGNRLALGLERRGVDLGSVELRRELEPHVLLRLLDRLRSLVRGTVQAADVEALTREAQV